MIAIYQPGLQEAAMLAALGRCTFEQAFASQNTPENMAAYVSTAYTTEQLEQELCDQESVFHVAHLGKKPVGYAKLRRNTLPDGVEDIIPGGNSFPGNSISRNIQTPFVVRPCVELQRIYVLREYLGSGIGKLLMQQCLHTATREGFATIWLGVWEHNPKAIGFYERHGFTVFGSHIFHVGDDPQTDLLMRREL